MEAYETKGYLKLQLSPLTPPPLPPHHPPSPIPFPLRLSWSDIFFDFLGFVLLPTSSTRAGYLRLVYSCISDAYLRALHTVGAQATLMTG